MEIDSSTLLQVLTTNHTKIISKNKNSCTLKTDQYDYTFHKEKTETDDTYTYTCWKINREEETKQKTTITDATVISKIDSILE